MAQKKRCLMIGAGGMAHGWIRHFFPNFKDRMEIVGLAEIRPEVLKDQGDFLGLADSQRFLNMDDAFGKVEADFCTIVIPPAHHRQAAVGAAEQGMDILSEKPIADTWEDCVAIYQAVQKSGIKMQIVQNYRFTPRILTVKKVINDGLIGEPNYIMGRFAADYRIRGAWGMFRHEIPHGLMVEGAVHHFDQIRNVSGADCQTISGWDWNPGHPSFDGECCGTYVIRMSNGMFAHYEGNGLEAGWQNSWHREFYRIEGIEGAVLVDSDDKVKLLKHSRDRGVVTEEVPLVPATPWDGHNAIICQFLDWLDGGPEPPTVLSDNMKTAAMLFGAVEASETNQSVDVAAKVQRVLKSV